MNLHSNKNLLTSEQLAKLKPKAVHRSENADFLFVPIFYWDKANQSISLFFFGAVSSVLNPMDLAFGRFASIVPILYFKKLAIKPKRPMKTLSNEEIRAIFAALEHTERAVCLTYTIIAFLTEARSVHSMGRTFEVGLYEAVNELEVRFTELEKAAKKLHTHPKLSQEDSHE